MNGIMDVEAMMMMMMSLTCSATTTASVEGAFYGFARIVMPEYCYNLI